MCVHPFPQNNNEPPPLEDPPSYEGHTPAPEPPSEENYSGQEFPVKVLTSLDEQLNRPKWVVPVRPGDELEKLLKFSIVMCREGVLISLCVPGEGRGGEGREKLSVSVM